MKNSVFRGADKGKENGRWAFIFNLSGVSPSCGMLQGSKTRQVVKEAENLSGISLGCSLRHLEALIWKAFGSFYLQYPGRQAVLWRKEKAARGKKPGSSRMFFVPLRYSGTTFRCAY